MTYIDAILAGARAWRTPKEIADGKELLRSYSDLVALKHPKLIYAMTLNAIQEMARRSYLIELHQLRHTLGHQVNFMSMTGSYGELLPPVQVLGTVFLSGHNFENDSDQTPPA